MHIYMTLCTYRHYDYLCVYSHGMYVHMYVHMSLITVCAYVVRYISTYGTNHIKLNVLRVRNSRLVGVSPNLTIAKNVHLRSDT